MSSEGISWRGCEGRDLAAHAARWRSGEQLAIPQRIPPDWVPRCPDRHLFELDGIRSGHHAVYSVQRRIFVRHSRLRLPDLILQISIRSRGDSRWHPSPDTMSLLRPGYPPFLRVQQNTTVFPRAPLCHPATWEHWWVRAVHRYSRTALISPAPTAASA